MNKKEENNNQNLLESIKPKKIIYPILIGLSVVGYMLYHEFDINALNEIKFTNTSLLFITIAILCMIIRDLGYMFRLRVLTDNYLTWKKCFRTIMLWEFTSAITPSAIGGTSVAILFVHKEGLSVGKSSAVVMATSFLDELYFIMMFPLIIITLNHSGLWQIGETGSFVSNSLFWISVIGYGAKLAYLSVLTYGLFYNPRHLKWILLKIFKLPILKKWKHGANDAGTEIIESSANLKKKHFSFWLKAFIATFFSWTARYWVVNAMFAAFWFTRYDWSDHFLMFARQLVMWIMMLVSPTPGGSGFAEYVFSRFLGEFLPGAGLAVAMAVVWRLISYYPYLFAGVVILPHWIKTKFGK